MEPFIFLLFATGIIAYIIISQFFSNKAKVKRKLKNADLIRIADFKDGDIARITGNVEFISTPLISPLSKRECAYYYVHIEQQVSSGKSSSWDTIIEEEVSGDFLIKDGDSYAYINDKNLKTYIVQDKSYSSGFLNDASEGLEKYLNSKGHKSEGLFGFNKTMRYKEGVLERGEKIAVFGTGKWIDAVTLKIPESYKKVLEIKATANEPIYLSDDPGTTIKNIKKNSLNRHNDNPRKHYKK